MSNIIPDNVDILIQVTSNEVRALGKAIVFWMQAHRGNLEHEDIGASLASISQKIIRGMTQEEKAQS